MKRVVEGQALSHRVLAIQNHEVDISDLLNEYRPFIHSIILKTTGRSVSTYSDEMAIAQLAFVEAVQSYDERKGHFLAFCRWIIRVRLIDYYRRECRKNREIAFSNLPEHMKKEINDEEATRQINNPVKLEIQALAMDILAYGIKFEDLVKTSPKAEKTKTACKKAVQFVMSNEDALKQLRKSRRLPIVKIQENCMIPRKLLERHRKYIIAVIEILLGDYPYLKEYVGGYLS